MTYLGYDIVSTISGYVYRKPGGNAGTEKTLTAAFRKIRVLVNGEPKCTGAVLPEERDTNRLERDWARREVAIREREVELDRLKSVFNMHEEQPDDEN